MGAVIVIGGIGPEAEADPGGFDRTVRDAERRLGDVQLDSNDG